VRACREPARRPTSWSPSGRFNAPVRRSRSCLWARTSASHGCGRSWPVDPLVVNSGNARTAFSRRSNSSAVRMSNCDCDLHHTNNTSRLMVVWQGDIVVNKAMTREDRGDGATRNKAKRGHRPLSAIPSEEAASRGCPGDDLARYPRLRGDDLGPDATSPAVRVLRRRRYESRRRRHPRFLPLATELGARPVRTAQTLRLQIAGRVDHGFRPTGGACLDSADPMPQYGTSG
jgi:hypothetical protein